MDKPWKDNTNTAVLYPTEVKTTLLNIDSRFRDRAQSTSSSDFLIRLPRTYKNVITLRMSSIELPNTWYAFSSDHHTTSFLVNGTVITIPDGNYADPTDFAAAIQSEIINSGNPENESINVEFDNTVTQKITIYNANAQNPSPFTLEFGSAGTYTSNLRSSFEPYNSGIGYLMGFTSDSYSNSNAYTAEYVTNTIGDNYVFLQLLDLDDCMESFSYGSTSIKAFAKIIIDANKNALIYDNGANTVSKEIKFAQPTNISTFRVRLLDAYGSTINLMADFSFTLELHEVISSKVYEAYRNNLTADL